MIEKTLKLAMRYEELSKIIVLPEEIADNKSWKKLVKEHAALEDIYNAHNSLQKIAKELFDAEASFKLEKDSELQEMFYEEISDLKNQLEELSEKVKVLLLPKDVNDDKNVIIEIRAGAGGDEAALFASRLVSMYIGFAMKRNWKIEMSYVNENEIGGIREATFMIMGNDVYSVLKFESGVHRVQRVPETETQGRIHTSTATVAILPEVEEIDVEILAKDLKVDTYRSGGAGGQHVNKTESAIRLTHLPTGLVVACQEERSQIKNREKAMNYLRAKLFDFYQSAADKEYAQNRKSQIGTGDRSERIRTYNFPQDRITDHRIGFTQFGVETFLAGSIEEMVRELRVADQKAKLENF